MAHLFAHARIDADRRTPLANGIGQPLLPGAQAWAAAVIAPDPTCARCLIALAAFGWAGQVDEMALAEMAGVSVRSVQRHRPHLVRAELVAFTPVPVKSDNGRNLGSKPHRYTLLSQFPAPRLTGAAWDQAPAQAASIIDRVRWFTTTSRDERSLAIRSVTWFLRNGWPERALLIALDHTEDRQAYAPGGYLAKILRKLPVEYILPAEEVVTQRTAPHVVDCPICKTPFRTTLTGHPLCGGGFCLEAGADSLPAAPIFKIA
ncbi:hypothetical protein [Streptomyces jumonjinensis]|uniref:hypothetical protein n=1 Tax=Streptomyces jumonjinensis TaxID=1945 RepID=UPI00378FF2E8